jgi:cytochrome c
MKPAERSAVDWRFLTEEERMKSFLIAAVAVAAGALAGTAQASEALAKEKGCLACHDIQKKKMGPAYKDVAAKYKGKADAEAMLVTKVSEGKGHPKVKANADETKTLVKWILAM